MHSHAVSSQLTRHLLRRPVTCLSVHHALGRPFLQAHGLMRSWTRVATGCAFMEAILENKGNTHQALVAGGAAARALEPLSYHMRDVAQVTAFRAERSRAAASWLVRMVSSDRGEGTSLLRDGQKAPAYKDAIVSKLIDSPLLVNGLFAA